MTLILFYGYILIGKMLRFYVEISYTRNGFQIYLNIFSIALLNRKVEENIRPRFKIF